MLMTTKIGVRGHTFVNCERIARVEDDEFKMFVDRK